MEGLRFEQEPTCASIPLKVGALDQDGRERAPGFSGNGPQFVAPNAGTYFVGLGDLDDFDQEPLAGGSGSFGLQTGSHEAVVTPIEIDAPEPNGTRAESMDVTSGTARHGTAARRERGRAPGARRRRRHPRATRGRH